TCSPTPAASASPPPGPARARRAGFTDARQAHALAPAFAARGFSVLAGIGADPGFDTAPIADIASA
ncbi:MAG TPA: hypothetical protein PKY87_05095, partial [Terricaulis sp.]|nr:hypothetical protein [Terricaulis sp.]